MSEPQIEEALKRIAEAKANKSTELNLSSLTLKELPKELATLTSLTFLDCSYNNLVTLKGIEELTVLNRLECTGNKLDNLNGIENHTCLTKLDCKHNYIRNLDNIKELNQLRELDCSSNLLGDLVGLESLTSLTELHCCLNGLTDLQPIMGLTAIIFLSCSENELINLNDIENLTSLTKLHCGSNKLTHLTPIQKLKSLRELICSSNKLVNLSGLENQTSLKELDCSGNPLGDLSDIKNCKSLIYLRCCEIGLTDFQDIKNLKLLACIQSTKNNITDLKGLKNLSGLTILICQYGALTDLSGLENLKLLQHIDCSYNSITSLAAIKESSNLKECIISDNPITNRNEIRHLASKVEQISIENNHLNLRIPQELVAVQLSTQKAKIDGTASLHYPDISILTDYFTECDKGVALHNNAKMIFIGNGRVGKSTLAYCLEHNRAPKKDLASTNGIDSNYKELFDDKGIAYNCTFLDCGGQEIYHAVHRLFFASNAIYLVMWAEETDELKQEYNHELSYWLNLINLHGQNSEIVVIKNQLDRKSVLPLAHPALFDDKFKDIQQVGISAKEYQEISSVTTAIGTLLSKLSEEAPQIPSSWLSISDWIESKRKQSIKFISFESFEHQCNEEKINSAKSLAFYLDKTGECIYLENEKTIIIDRNWGLEAVYMLFDDKLGATSPRQFISNSNGAINEAAIRSFMSKYEPDKFKLILSFMIKVNICFKHPKFDIENQLYIFPSLLNKKPPSCTFLTSYSLKYQINLPAYHRLVIEDFIRVTAQLSETALWWFNGIEITVNELNTSATIVTCPETATVKIYISGRNQSELLKKVLNTLNKSEFFVPENQLICIPEISNDWVDVQKVKDAQEAGNERISSINKSRVDCKEYFKALEYKQVEDLENVTNGIFVDTPDIRFTFKHSVMLISAFLFDMDIFAFTLKPPKVKKAKAHGHLLNLKNSNDNERGYSKNTTNDHNWRKWLNQCIRNPKSIQGAAIEKFALHLCGFITGLLKEMQSESGICFDVIPVTATQLSNELEENPQLSQQLNALLLYTANRLISHPQKFYKALFRTLNYNGYPPVNVVSYHLEVLKLPKEEAELFGIPEDYLDKVLEFKAKGLACS